MSDAERRLLAWVDVMRDLKGLQNPQVSAETGKTIDGILDKALRMAVQSLEELRYEDTALERTEPEPPEGKER